jgi:hypothetical protein
MNEAIAPPAVLGESFAPKTSGFHRRQSSDIVQHRTSVGKGGI